MHTVDLSLDEVTKVEGAAAFEVRVRDGKVERAQFSIQEYKRFYTQAMRGKPTVALPQLLARICGTCSNAHLLCSIESVEKALGVVPSTQSMRMKHLTMHGLILRDHALHLYLFVLPDLHGKDNFLEFDENIPAEHEILHDAFDLKAAGNELAMLIAGRSVHAVNPMVGGFMKVPTPEAVAAMIARLQKVRPAAVRTLERFAASPWVFDRKTHFQALVADPFSYLDGMITSDDGSSIPESEYRSHLEHVVVPYSHASGYTYRGASYMVGSLARINLSKDTLHPKTRETAKDVLARFPSTNIYDNNLAQAVEILHSIDEGIDLLTTAPFVQEPPAKPTRKSGIGIGVMEAPRGTLYHQVEVGEDGRVIRGEIVVPTGQNQLNIEQDLARRVEELLPGNPTKEQLQHELEQLIRAYDPCMSCASHFLTLKVDRG